MALRSGWYCTRCGALYRTLGAGYITCQACGESGLRGFRRKPVRIDCRTPGCAWKGWDDGGVNDDLGAHLREEHRRSLRFYDLIRRIEDQAHDGGILPETMAEVHRIATDWPRHGTGER